ncbi:Type II secretion system (T2SS), protein F [uncultured archaeon]|nr:Type II secretion system (T2SS), protein F [uncultured archaeon]
MMLAELSRIFDAIPGHAEKRRIAAIEAELPLFLRMLAMLLDMNVPFAQALEAASRNGECGKEFSRAVREIENGAGVPKALAKLAESEKGEAVKKSAIQMISAYEQGGGGAQIRRIGDDMVSLQRYRMRDFVSKSSLFGLMFVIFAAVVPTFFLVFATAGKLALGIDVGGAAFAAVFLLAFPAVDAGILLISDAQMPPAVFRAERGSGTIAAFVLLACALAFVMLLGLGWGERLLALAAVIGGSWLLFRNEYAEERRVEKLEEALPDALLGVSGLPRNYGIARIFGRMAEAGGPVADEAGKTLRQLEANVSPDKALEDLWGRNRSFMLRRMGELMLNAHAAGANISEKMHEMAEDLLGVAELRRERENAVSMQKYTLFIGALIVPLILGASLSLVSQMSSFIEGGSNAEVLGMAPNVIAAYVIMYAALSALYVGHAEERRSRLVPYFTVMALAGQIGFYILSQQFA